MELLHELDDVQGGTETAAAAQDGTARTLDVRVVAGGVTEELVRLVDDRVGDLGEGRTSGTFTRTGTTFTARPGVLLATPTRLPTASERRNSGRSQRCRKNTAAAAVSIDDIHTPMDFAVSVQVSASARGTVSVRLAMPMESATCDQRSALLDRFGERGACESDMAIRGSRAGAGASAR